MLKVRKPADNPDPKERLFENAVLDTICLEGYDWANGMCQAWRIATGTEYVLSTVDGMKGTHLARIYYEDGRSKAEIIVND